MTEQFSKGDLRILFSPGPTDAQRSLSLPPKEGGVSERFVAACF
jgi:hypothetical protein